MEDNNSKELILFLFEKLKDEGYVGVSEYRAQKLLFKLERELPDDHPLKQSIPYYWYFHGPFSEPLRYKLKELKGKYLHKTINNDKELFTLNEDYKTDLDIVDSDVENILDKLLEREIFFQIDRIVYDEDAPYPFMPLYKFDFLEAINRYNQLLYAGKEDSDLIEKAIKICYKCEAKLPFESYFLVFEDLFSRFITNLDMLTRNNVGTYCSSELLNRANDTWYAFGQGVRVKHHSSYYEDDRLIEEWDNQFQSSLKSLDSNLNLLSEMARNSSRKPVFSDTSKKILSSSVGTYLKL
jgi:hypothetical protein